MIDRIGSYPLNAFDCYIMTSDEIRQQVESLAAAGYDGEQIVDTIGQENLSLINPVDEAILDSKGIHLYSCEPQNPFVS